MSKDYKVQWTPELRQAVDNRIIDYLSQGYSQQEAEDKALQDQLDHTTFNFSDDVVVTAKAPEKKQVAVEADWNPGYTKFMSGQRYYADNNHKKYLDGQRNDMTNSIRETTDKWGNAIGTGVEIASGFTPLWWVAPAVRTGLDLSEGDYKGAAFNAALSFVAPYAVSKGIQYITPYAKSAILAGKLNRQIRNTKLPQSQLNVTELHPHYRMKVGDVEINDPNLAYRQVGESIAKEFPITSRQTGITFGNVPFKNPMYAQGHLWYGIPQEKNSLTGLLTTNQPLQYANMVANPVNTPSIITSKDGLVTQVFDPNSTLFAVGTRRIPSPGQLNSTNTSSYIYEPGYGYRKVVTQQPKTSRAFFERQPNTISEAERLGIPKGERNQWLSGNTANAAWDTGLGLKNSKYMQHLTDLHFKLAAPKTQTSGVYLNESRYGQNFNVFDRNKIAGPNAEGNIFDPYGSGFVGIYNPPYRGFFFRPLETQNKMIAQGFASMDGTRAYRLNVTNPRVTKSETSKQLYKLWDPRHDQYVPSENNGLIRYTSAYDTPFEIQAMDPKQIKLYQWNTYDDAGNLIPLSQRHNFTNNDIRYKSGGSIHIKKKHKGKFSKVRDYVDYKNNK